MNNEYIILKIQLKLFLKLYKSIFILKILSKIIPMKYIRLTRNCVIRFCIKKTPVPIAGYF